MRHVASLIGAGQNKPSVVTIGMFDGIHRGHQHLIRQLVDFARAADQTPVVLTFYPHPELVLRGYRPGYYLTLPDQKADLLGGLGVELVVSHPFNDEIRHMRAAAFVDQLLDHLEMSALWVGADFALGYQREGNTDFLHREAEQKGFTLRIVDLMDAGDERVSSSRIRDALQVGDMAQANHLLGRPYRLPGEVVQGAGRGRTIGIPTANLQLHEDQAIPARGVYAGMAVVDGRTVPAVINIGLRPTFAGNGSLTVEAHLLDFAAELYGRRIQLDFVARLRDEQKFPGVEALVQQIRRDIERARDVLASRSPSAGSG